MPKKLPVFDAVLDGPETGVNEIAFVKNNSRISIFGNEKF